MASSSPANPDTVVTLKVSFNGSTRRLTLPLADVSSSSLLHKIRHFLSISADAKAVFERHSDSAAAYVELDPNNNAVWKQLYRAAKAKRKLKLRVTLHDSEEEDDEVADRETTGPKPVTVEDEPEQQGHDFAQSQPDIVSPPFPHDDLLEKAMSELQLGSEKKHEQESTQQPTESMCVAPKKANFAVCCNNCDRTIPDAHYHCSTCDQGDFDLCPACVEMGITCYNSDHWLLKRFVRGDFILVSTTEKVAPKPKIKEEEPEKIVPQCYPTAPMWSSTVDLPKPTLSSACVPSPAAASRSFSITPMRTCNSCVQELPDKEFLHCLSCDDFDLCKACFGNDQHGHHPQHAFAPAVEGTPMPADILRRLAPGRDQRHSAICDGCDKFIFGIRHKCLDCPDWDYCADCFVNAGFVHPDHRFVPIYEQIAEARTRTTSRPSHYGICCDGPLCNGSRKTYIVGDRFKCAVCHDTDFCASCEASPANTHNKTHPLIKFKTPVRRVEVKTKGEDENGQQMPVMGDRLRPKVPNPRADTVKAADGEAKSESVSSEAQESDKSAYWTAAAQARQQLHQRRLLYIAKQRREVMANVSAEQQARQATLAHQTTVQKQHEQIATAQRVAAEFEVQRRVIESQRLAFANTVAAKPSPIAIFERDTVADGTVMPPNQVFEQTWVLRNGGDAPWPAGCSVKFVGGDYMGHIDSSHPAGIHDLVSASESTVCYDALAPGQEFPFTVLLRTPAREGKVISYWRLQSEDGLKFGHRLWCDVSVQKPKAVEPPEVAKGLEVSVSGKEQMTSELRSDKSAESSQMIFPKVDSEKARRDVSEDNYSGLLSPVNSPPSSVFSSPAQQHLIDDFEICGEDETWAEDSDEGLLTDEEYDILDASDEEYIDEQQKNTQK